MVLVEEAISFGGADLAGYCLCCFCWALNVGHRDERIPCVSRVFCHTSHGHYADRANICGLPAPKGASIVSMCAAAGLDTWIKHEH